MTIVITINVQAQSISLIYKRGSFVYDHWGCTLDYRPLSYPCDICEEEIGAWINYLFVLNRHNKVKGFLSVSLSLTKDLPNRWTNMVLLYSIASHMSWDGL